MKRWIVPALVGGAALVISGSWLAYTHGDAAPRGEGSFRAADRIHAELESLRAGLPQLQLPHGYHKFPLDDDAWYVVTGIDTHEERDGGTVGILTSEGEIGIFFTHVCGPGENPLIFRGDNPTELLGELRRMAEEWQPGTERTTAPRRP
jgi:hypothetical protein